MRLSPKAICERREQPSVAGPWLIRVIRWPLFAFASMLLAGCGAVPQFNDLSGTKILDEFITTKNYRNRTEVKVPVVVYKPSQERTRRAAVIFLSGCDGGHWDIHRALARNLNKKGVTVAEVQTIEKYGNACVDTTLMTGREFAGHVFHARDLLVRRGLADQDNIALVGLSLGGWTTLLSAFLDVSYHYDTNKITPFAAGVAIYPHCDPVKPRSKSSMPVLLLGGDADQSTFVRDCVRAYKDDAGVEIHIYKGATHGWDAPFPPRAVKIHRGYSFMAYDVNATKDGIERAQKFLEKHLKLE